MRDVQDLDEDPPDYQRGPGRRRTIADAHAEWLQLRDLANTVPCPPPPHGCNAPPGTPCPDLRKFPAHPARIANARKAQR